MRSPCENNTEYSGSMPGENLHVTFYFFFSAGAFLISTVSLLNVREIEWVPYMVCTEADMLTVAYPYKIIHLNRTVFVETLVCRYDFRW